MRSLGKHALDVVWNMIASALSTGILGWLAHEFDIHPEIWVQDTLGHIWGARLAPYVWWLVFGLVSLFLAIGWKVIGLFRRQKDCLPPSEDMVRSVTSVADGPKVKFVPMAEAARRVYEAMRAANSPSLPAVERLALEKYDRSILAACADRIFDQMSTVYGTRHGSNEIASLPDDASLEIGFGDLRFSPDGNALTSKAGIPIWTNLCVRESNFSDYLEAIAGLTPFNIRLMPIREAGKKAFEAIQSEPAAEFVRIGQENDAEAKIDWMIRWFLQLEPPPTVTAVERPGSTSAPVSFGSDRPRLISGTDMLEFRGRRLERARIFSGDVGRAVTKLRKLEI